MKVYVVSQGYIPIGVCRDRETALAVSKGANGALFGGEDDFHVHEFPVVEESSILFEQSLCKAVNDAERE